MHMQFLHTMVLFKASGGRKIFLFPQGALQKISEKHWCGDLYKESMLL